MPARPICSHGDPCLCDEEPEDDPVTEAHVETALATWYGSPYPTGWDNPEEDRRDMRRVLEDFATGCIGRGSDDA